MVIYLLVLKLETKLHFKCIVTDTNQLSDLALLELNLLCILDKIIKRKSKDYCRNDSTPTQKPTTF